MKMWNFKFVSKQPAKTNVVYNAVESVKPISNSSSSFQIMHIPQSWVMSCMADVHEVQ